jgi:hypothetical protein
LKNLKFNKNIKKIIFSSLQNNKKDSSQKEHPQPHPLASEHQLVDLSGC